MRRIRLVLAVLMMMVLLATTAAPAMAWGRDGHCCFRDRDDFRVFRDVDDFFFPSVFTTFGIFPFNTCCGFNGLNTGGLTIRNGNVF